MKSIPFTLALTVSMAVLAWPAAADAPAHWGCKGGRTDEAEISSRATHIGMRRVLEQYQNRWDAAYMREQCEAFAEGRPHEISCLRGRRDWDAIEAMVPDAWWSLSKMDIRPHYLALQSEDDGLDAARDYCRNVGAIPTKWVR